MDERYKDLFEKEGYPEFLKRAAKKIYGYATSREVDLKNPWESGWRKGMLSALIQIKEEKENE